MQDGKFENSERKLRSGKNFEQGQKVQLTETNISSGPGTAKDENEKDEFERFPLVSKSKTKQASRRSQRKRKLPQ